MEVRRLFALFDETLLNFRHFYFRATEKKTYWAKKSVGYILLPEILLFTIRITNNHPPYVICSYTFLKKITCQTLVIKLFFTVHVVFLRFITFL
jgi:hypothetical protein